MSRISEGTVREWVADRMECVEVFKKYGIDFCCGGDRTLKEVCEEKGISEEKLKEELSSVQSSAKALEPNSMTLDRLIDYIKTEFHDEIRIKIPIIREYLEKVCLAHRTHHTELFLIRDTLEEGFEELLRHLAKEEEVLFPFVSRMKMIENQDVLLSPMTIMEEEHDLEGERYRRIALLTNQYEPPEDACPSFIYLYKLLNEFENRLHLHIHIENNILFHKIKQIIH